VKQRDNNHPEFAGASLLAGNLIGLRVLIADNTETPPNPTARHSLALRAANSLSVREKQAREWIVVKDEAAAT
jgi:hypothetical protein